MTKQDLKALEERSIYLVRDANEKFRNVAVLWGTGKDSTILLYLIKKAFRGKVPFAVVSVDNGAEFPETIALRNELARTWKLNLIVVPSGSESGARSPGCCGESKEQALSRAIAKRKFDAVLVSTRSDEERYFRNRVSSKSSKGQIEMRDDRSSKLEVKGCATVAPILDWTGIDVWNYIESERIPLNPLYLALNGSRYGRIGCTRCSVPIKSGADSVSKIIKESEARGAGANPGGRSEKDLLLQKLRALGY